jgi:tripartite-type tricarboxylate transporter receptor subunit TctC
LGRLRANPAEALYGSPGIGTGPHFTGIEFGRLSGLNLRHLPYRGTALPDLLAGRLPLYIGLATELIEQHKSGAIRNKKLGC